MGAMEMMPLIERKKRGEELSAEELAALLEGYVAGAVPDYQLAAWLMAVCWRGMGEAETLAMPRAMVASGEVLDWEGIGRGLPAILRDGALGDRLARNGHAWTQSGGAAPRPASARPVVDGLGVLGRGRRGVAANSRTALLVI